MAAPVKLVNVSQQTVFLRCTDGSVLTLPRRTDVFLDVDVRAEEMEPLTFIWGGRVLTCTQARTVIGPLKEPIAPPKPGVLYIASIVTYNAAKAPRRTDVCTPDMTKMVRDEKGAPKYTTGIAWP